MVLSAAPPGDAWKTPLPALIDDTAVRDPDRIFFVLPERNDTRHGSRTITYLQFNQAVDRAVSWLEETSKPWVGRPVLAFISRPYDLRYLIFLVAGMKTNLIFLLPSPRNSIENHMHVLRKVSCTIIISDMDLKDLVDESGCQAHKPPTLEQLLDGDYAEHRPFVQSYEQCWDRPACILHSSGSTGPPKPVVWTHGWLAALNGSMIWQRLDDAKQGFSLYRNQPNMIHLSTLPLFHAAGVIHSLLINVFNRAPHMIPPEAMPPTAESVAALLSTHRPDSILTSPSILEEMSEDTDVLKPLQSMHFVAYGGAPMSQSAGDMLTAQGVYLYPSIGSTETGPLPQYLSTRRDAFNYQRWPDQFPGVIWREVGEGLYEMVLRRCDLDMPIFHTFPDLDEYATKDLYRRHPELSDHYLYTNRIDDVIVLSNGEKLVPLPMEDAIRRAGVVTGVIVAGFGHFSTAAIIEFDHVKTAGWTDSEKLEYVSPFIDEANAIAPGHARLSRDQVIFTIPAKPMIRSGKGSLIRGQNLKLYAAEIEQIYQNEGSQSEKSLDIEGMSDAQIQELVVDVLKPYNKNESVLDLDDDLFQAAGLDSAKVLELARQLHRQLRGGKHGKAKHIMPKLIYNHPSIASMSRALVSLRDGKSDSPEQHIADMKKIMSEFSSELVMDGRPDTPASVAAVPLIRSSTQSSTQSSAQPSAPHSPDDSSASSRRTSATSIGYCEEEWTRNPGEIVNDEKMERLPSQRQAQRAFEDRVVLLTGTTGSLGSYILDMLISDTQVAHVFALNRGSDAEIRQCESSDHKGLSRDFKKVTFLQGDLSQPSFGMSDTRYRTLLASVSEIIHNAWPVNFNKSLESFRPQVTGVRNLICFSNVSHRNSRIVFVSSVGTTAGWTEMHPGTGGAPEELIEDYRAPLTQGYSESKYISELLLAEAAKFGVSSIICRVGQIAGPVERVKGQWNRHEWLPSLVASSSYLKMLPKSLGPTEANVDWVPVDLVAKMVVELGIPSSDPDDAKRPTADFFNLVNPKPARWSDLLPSIRSYMPPETREIPFDEWVEHLRQSGEAERPDIERNPALKLMEFWTAMARGRDPSGLKTEKTARASKTMNQLSSVNEEWMSGWMEQWGFVSTCS